MPVIALVERDGTPSLPGALPIRRFSRAVSRAAAFGPAYQVPACNRTAARASDDPNRQIAVPANLLAGATVLCVGRSYPTLSVALGERVGLIGAFSVETATRYLNAREIDGVVIGDGLGPCGVEALFTELAEKFRDLPVGMLNNNACDEERPLIPSGRSCLSSGERVLAFVRQQAFEVISSAC
jgi:hypothetical protein